MRFGSWIVATLGALAVVAGGARDAFVTDVPRLDELAPHFSAIR